MPEIRDLQPADEREREPVPAALQRNTVDTLSAIALLMRHVADTGRCDGSTLTFDGRRLARITVQTVGHRDADRVARVELRRPGAALRFHRPAARRVQARRRPAGSAAAASRQRLVRPCRAGRDAGAGAARLPHEMVRGRDRLSHEGVRGIDAAKSSPRRRAAISGSSAKRSATASAPSAIAGGP